MDAELVCACGQVHPVKYADAGTQITCTCQQLIEVPKLSKLRKMVAEDVQRNEEEAKRNRPVVSSPGSTPYSDNQQSLIIVCVLYGIYLLIGIAITFYATSDLNLPTDIGTQRYIRFRIIVSFIVYVVLSIFACAGQTWAKAFLIIRSVLAIIGLIVLMAIDREMIYVVDIFFAFAFIV